MNFEEFLGNFPVGPGAGELPLHVITAGFGYVNDRLPEFIGPDISPSTAIDLPENPKVIIISAAGAVGKSTLAREIAYCKKVPIWDLAQAAAVGESSVTGQIAKSFGFSLASEFNGLLQGGRLFLIIDALDEARVKANEAGYEAFIANITEMAKNAESTPFILLARTQTAETTWLLLEDIGISTALYSIQPFTRNQAEQYIEARIQHLDPGAATRIKEHREPFIDSRNIVLNHLEKAVTNSDSVTDEAAREFLGYAPVLETVATLLAKEGNYQEFIASMKTFGDKTEQGLKRPLAVLDHVVKRLLDREQKQKLQANIRPALERVADETGWNSWDDLYSPEEQIVRLLSRILNIKIEACPEMPGEVRARYEEQLEIWLPEHPFLRDGSTPANKVFESYLFAKAMSQYMTEMSRAVEEQIMASDYKPSRLLADFYIHIGDQDNKAVIAERQIGVLYDSLLSGESDSLRVHLSIEAGEPDDADVEESEPEGEFELIYASSDHSDNEQIETRRFTIVEKSGGITFRRQLKEASIITRDSVFLGGDVDDFEIGPSVQIRCNTLNIFSSGFVVRPTRSKFLEGTAVVLEANACDSAISRKPLVRGSLKVCWPNSNAFPWSGYSFEPVEDETNNGRMHETYRRLRRIVLSLRSHSKGSLARVKDKIDHKRILKNALGEALLARLLNDGVMVLKGKFYHWVPEGGDMALGSSYDDFCQRRLTTKTKAYLKAFIEQNAHLF